MVWEEIQKKRLAEIVNEYVYSKECPIDSRYIRPYEKYKIERKFKKKLEDFYNKSWFSVEQFQADQDKIDAVILFYHSLSGTPKMTKHLAAKGRRDPEPSLADMNLLIYSKENRLPILSNDNDFNLFKDEIGNNNICYKIFPLKEISDSSILID
ncbi:MAG: hypothetical protein M1371_02605 [Actinobacteria bacterium]|nr:hypothetical protein [Actinomycetota bacterium]